MAITDRSTIWVDANGKTRQTILRGQAALLGPTLATVVTDLAVLSNAGRLREWEGSEVLPGTTGVTAVYQNVADWAQLLYAASDGSEVYITVPAPVSSLFLADQETVDITQITTLNTDVAGVVVTATGLYATTYLGGVRRRRLKEYQ